MNQDTILLWVNRVVTADDHTAFTRLVQAHQSKIRQFLRRLTAGNYSLADDLSQETFLLAYQKMHQFKSKGTFSAWLHTIAYRLFLKSIDNITTIQPSDSSNDERWLELTSASTINAVDADIYAEQLMVVLKPQERVVITLSCAVGLSHAEIAKITEMPLGSIKSLLLRGKEKIIKYSQQKPLLREEKPCKTPV